MRRLPCARPASRRSATPSDRWWGRPHGEDRSAPRQRSARPGRRGAAPSRRPTRSDHAGRSRACAPARRSAVVPCARSGPRPRLSRRRVRPRRLPRYRTTSPRSDRRPATGARRADRRPRRSRPPSPPARAPCSAPSRRPRGPPGRPAHRRRGCGSRVPPRRRSRCCRSPPTPPGAGRCARTASLRSRASAARSSNTMSSTITEPKPAVGPSRALAPKVPPPVGTGGACSSAPLPRPAASREVKRAAVAPSSGWRRVSRGRHGAILGWEARSVRRRGCGRRTGRLAARTVNGPTCPIAAEAITC